MKTPLYLRAWASRIARGAMGASIAGLAAAALDAAYTRGGEEERIDAGRALVIFVADVGLVAPVALVVGLVVATALVVLFPESAPTPASAVASLRARAKGRPADVAAFVPLAIVAAFLWMTLSAQLARALLGLDVAAPLAGLAIATAALVVGLLAALLSLALTPALRQALATASEGRPAFVDPAKTGLAALVVVGLLLGLGVATGGPSGEGGLLGIYGVLKRPELDLRAVGMLSLVALAALLASALASPRRTVAAALLALAPVLLVPRTAVSLGGEGAPVAQAIERDAPLGKLSLAAMRKLADRDRDGASALFGGGDCREGDASIGPLGVEIPDNGVDEDCSGSDLRAEVLAALAAPQAAPATATTSAAIPDDLNVVLITVDTLRADLGYAGYPQPVSPNLDKLAAESAVFLRAYALASYTGKSVGPMLLGKYGSETQRNWGHFNKFDDAETFLAERLSRAGVRTMGVHAHRYFGEFGGLDSGFDVVDMSAAPPESAKWDVADMKSSHTLTDAALALLQKPENTSGRFFLWVHYLDPHADYLRHDDVPSFGAGERALYDGEIAFTDKHIGRLIDGIRAAPWGKKTAIVVTSDHGEAFGEHKMVRHGFELWEPLVRVPLLVHVPGAKPARIDARRSTIDVTPTVLDLFHIERPEPGAEGPDFLSGTSLLPDVFLPEGQAPAERDVVIDMPAGPYNDARRALIHGDLKLIVSNNTKYALYDLGEDPEERKDLWRSPDARARIEERYAALRARLREIRVTGPRK
ncbi:sulfatase [Polyangium spumosum]|uniref:Sulfatase-like hydrolase/transferase n=1 Tax=Polyangium spumosum TaxID=889282 RepID=A0A6N7PUZ1_9BACT|nr:sulfatase [Polyangium spumosum]MRG94065.1 sulfatase-like hydrolase/transferase [Polyangium spumosum]